MEHRRKNKNRIRKKQKRLMQKRMIFFLGGFVLILVLAIGGINALSNFISEVKAERAAEEQARLEQEALEAEQKLIEEVLSKEEYEKELRALYKEYPQVGELLKNREDYEDWLIEYLVNNEEAVDWVVEYPEYMAKTEEELEEAGLKDIEDTGEGRNDIPLLFQWDQRWGYLTYGSGQIAVEGCGPVCLSMAAVGLTGDGSITPKVVADLSMENGYYVEGEGTGWSLIDIGAEKLGLSSEQIMEWSTAAVKKPLQEGNVIICSVGPGDFTTQGHFIVIVKLNEDGTVMVNDPNSLENSEKSWEIQDLLDQTKGMWAISLP